MLFWEEMKAKLLYSTFKRMPLPLPFNNIIIAGLSLSGFGKTETESLAVADQLPSASIWWLSKKMK